MKKLISIVPLVSCSLVAFGITGMDCNLGWKLVFDFAFIFSLLWFLTDWNKR